MNVRLKNKKIAKKERDRDIHRVDMGIVNLDSEFEVVEAYKSFRTNITFVMSQRKKRRILFTSAVPMEGKTSTVCNFAVVLAQAGYSVLLIDGDMRKPRVHRYFNKTKSKYGLSSALSTGNVENTIEDSGYPNLKLMFAGLIPPNPAELLEGRYAEEFFDRLNEQFDYVLIDTPPVNVITDALVLKKYDFSMVIVMREGYSDHRDVQKEMKAIEMVGGDLIGAILIGSQNTISQKKEKFNHGYGYGYGYGYSYYGTKESND